MRRRWPRRVGQIAFLVEAHNTQHAEIEVGLSHKGQNARSPARFFEQEADPRHALSVRYYYYSVTGGSDELRSADLP